ncbi:putative endoplasmic reticulum metallopeptidase 1 [Grifola frondosa]|uniref:Peptide hydrolase n=1 Tax=Grifola frondosa TaxID=5627 RepID=A0A1C7MBM3_GRIFR|nr:putative endoplasmic reticulum metallopeptidase 1 [Grifola frondosa]
MEEIVTKRLHISGLTPAITPADLAQRLTSFGSVKALDGFGQLDALGQPRKFAYVTLETTKPKLARCMNLLSGATWKGAKLRLGEAKPDFGERITEEHTALKRVASATDGEPPKKRRCLPRGVQGFHAADMSLVTPENAASRPGWHVTSLGRLIRPVRMRPTHPLPEPLLSAAREKGHKGAEKKDKGLTKRKRVKEPPARARRRTIDPMKWGSQHLKGVFLETGAIANPNVEPYMLRLAEPVTEESDEESERGDEQHEASAPRRQAAEAFGEPGGVESVGSDVDVDEITNIETHHASNDQDDTSDERVLNAPMDVEEPVALIVESPQQEQTSAAATEPPQKTRLKDLFAPREEDAGFSLLGHLDLDIELDDVVPFDFQIPSKHRPDIVAASSVISPAAPSIFTLDASHPLFFPPESSGYRGEGACWIQPIGFSTMSTSPHVRWGPVRSLLALSPLLLAVPFFSLKAQYALPKPVTELVDPSTGLPQLSEARILEHAKYLSEDVGYRTVGTREHALGDAWMVKQAEALRAECESIVQAHPERKLECEVWHQQGSGSHRFDMMGKRLYKTYVNLTNIVVRVSDGTSSGKEHAVLVNAHLDSTLPSPALTRDYFLVQQRGGVAAGRLTSIFDPAPVAKTVRAVINLEAAGTTGPELLFQATSEQMIQAYAHVPRPFGTIVANEIFSSGIIMSDTDFRQFELYLNVTGLDMAVVGNSYLYHMRKDLVENIEPGVAQHMADNVLALLLYLSSPESPLPSLTEGYSPPTTVFFQHYGHFFVYSFRTASVLYSVLFVLSVILVRSTYVNPAPALKNGKSMLGDQLRGAFANGGALVGALIGVNVVAFFMQRVVGRGLSWFSTEMSCIILYAPAALTGALASQLLIGRVKEHSTFTSLFLLQSFIAAATQLFGIGSGGVFYAIGQLTPLVTGTEIFCSALDVFVPLTGRMGEAAPAEHIIANIVAVSGAYTLPLMVPFVHRYSHRILVRMVVLLTMLTGITMAVFSMRSPFDAMHQKRLFVIHMENVTSQEQHLHVAAADGAPGFDLLAERIAAEFSVPGVSLIPVVMDDRNSDWDTVYPFSGFLTPYKFDLALKSEYVDAPEHDFTVFATNDTIDLAARTRGLTLVVNHPGIIWTAVAFDAHVLKWTLDNSPPDEFARHHIKEASFYGHDTWTVDLLIKLPESETAASLKVNFVGIHEKAMWPGKKAEKEKGGRAMQLFEEFDEWIERETGGTVDTTLLGCVGGVTIV